MTQPQPNTPRREEYDGKLFHPDRHDLSHTICVRDGDDPMDPCVPISLSDLGFGFVAPDDPDWGNGESWGWSFADACPCHGYPAFDCPDEFGQGVRTLMDAAGIPYYAGQPYVQTAWPEGQG